jgi:FixJ family two-component response regulator
LPDGTRRYRGLFDGDLVTVLGKKSASGGVLRLLARGSSNADIAQSLNLTEGTVRNYVSAILAKLGVTDRTQAALLALRHGLVDADER